MNTTQDNELSALDAANAKRSAEEFMQYLEAETGRKLPRDDTDFHELVEGLTGAERWARLARTRAPMTPQEIEDLRESTAIANREAEILEAHELTIGTIDRSSQLFIGRVTELYLRMQMARRPAPHVERRPRDS